MNIERFLENLKEYCDIEFLGRRQYQSQVLNNEFQIQTQIDNINRIGTLSVYVDYVDGQVQYIVSFRMKEIEKDSGYGGYRPRETTQKFRYVFDINGRRLE